MSMLPLALAHAARGWRVFPVSGDKRPRVKGWPDEATTDPEKIGKWWQRWPSSIPGIATGEGSDIYVVDVDNLDALDALPWLEQCDTFTIETPRGGRHYYFTWVPGDWRNTGGDKAIATKVDTRGEGGYVVAPGAVTERGSYAVINDTSLRPMPDELVAALRALARPQEQRRAVGGSTPYGRTALARNAEDVARAQETTRNMTLNAKAYRVGQLVGGGEIDEEEARRALIEAGRLSGLPLHEVESTVKGAIRDGQREPATAPPRLRLASRPKTTESSAGGSVLALQQEAPDVADAFTGANTPMFTRTVEAVRVGLKGALHYCSLRQAIIIDQPLPWPSAENLPRRWGKPDTLACRLWLERISTRSISEENVDDAVELIAHERRRDPVGEYLGSLKWDGTPRIGTWLTTYLKADDDARTRNVGKWWLISAAARALDPGCQVDHMLILEGAQGIGKSTALRTLCPDDSWFTDAPIDPRSKDSMQLIAGKWLVEWAELEGMRRSDVTAVKAFLSQRIENYRRAFGRHVMDERRRCVFAATTNESTYLQDDTGNRRFWPVTVRRADTKALDRDRDQLWAEAVHCFRTGVPWYPVTAEDHTGLAEATSARRATDPWCDILEPWTKDRDETTAKEALDRLGMPEERRTRADDQRMARVLRTLGFAQCIRGPNSARKRVYVRVIEGDQATPPPAAPTEAADGVQTGSDRSDQRDRTPPYRPGGPPSLLSTLIDHFDHFDHSRERGRSDAEVVRSNSDAEIDHLTRENDHALAEPPAGAGTGSPDGGHPSPPDTAADASGDDWRSAAADIVTDLWGQAEEP